MNAKEWTRDHFMSNESACKLILDNSEALGEIPCINSSSLDNFKDGQLVRFRGMVQDMFNPEYYFENYEVTDTRTGESSLRSGIYMDSARCLPHENISLDSQRNKNSERQTYFIISVPGLNEWAKEKVPQTNIKTNLKNVSKRSLETSNEEAMDCSEPIKKKEKILETSESTTKDSAPKETRPAIVSKEHILNFPIPNDDGKACIVKIYENKDSHKLNEVLDIIGFLSLDPLHSAIHDSEDYMDDMEIQTHHPPASMVPRLHAVKVIPLAKNEIFNDPQLISKAECIRGDLQMVLGQLLFGDQLAADYLICHLISSIYMRKDFLCLGSFPLNISRFPLEKFKTFPKELYSMLAQLIPKSHYVELTLDCLNNLNFIPQKDYDCDRLTSGVLQLSDHTHLVIDETGLTSGQVTPCGRNNYNAINTLVQFQKVAYDFKFYPMDYETDIPVLILSTVKSFIQCNNQVALNVDSETEGLFPQVVEAAQQYLKDEDRLNNIRQYLHMLRHAKFEFDEEMTEVIQEDFVKMRHANKSYTGDDLHTLMVFARLMSLSYGKNTLTIDLWKKAFELEAERIARLPKRNNQVQS
ncbi:mini-chromosome maintenance complex-binding protein isoform X2 [Belonocnema kinseyi]|nr:mini-chromosome maintenance complex-binding protein isoform X2 [Belonocnema kinseyi]